MGRSSGVGQLVKGIVIGIVLLLAIIGTMSIFDQAKDNDYPKTSGNSTKPTIEQKVPSTGIPAPTININTPETQTKKTLDPEKDETETNTNVAIEEIKEKPLPLPEELAETPPSKEVKTYKPTLENERTLKEKPKEKTTEKKAEKVRYGLVKLLAINPNSKKKVLASFVVFNQKGKKVASANNTKEASFRLPIGRYKIVSTLKRSAKEARRARPVQRTKMIRVRSNKSISQTFKLEPATSLGVLQVSSKNAKTGKTMKANYVIQKENGITIATRNNVSQTLFRLKAGSYKVIVKNGDNTDIRTIVVEPGESTKEVFKLQKESKLGKVIIRVSETRTNRPINADIVITMRNGSVIQQLKSVSQTELSLPAGQYKIRVTGPNGQSNKTIIISAGKAFTETFRFDAPPQTPVKEVQITENVRITPAKETPKTIVLPDIEKKKKPIPKANGSIKLYARNNGNNVPLKSNFYVQLPNGKNIAKKVYSNSAQFSLEPGVYRITVRSQNRKNIVKTLRVISGQSSTEVFSLVSTLPPAKPKEPKKIAQAPITIPPILAPAKPAKVEKETKTTKGKKPLQVKTITIPNGFLSIAMQPASKTHFIVSNRSGKKVVELTGVPSANFKLDTGRYTVTAIKNKQRRTKKVIVKTGKTTRINFKSKNFQLPRNRNNTRRNTTLAPKGALRSRIINRSGQPLRGNLTVVNLYGQVVARANDVSEAVFDLPPEVHTIILNYNGLKGSERVRIRPRETTMQTFTIAP